MVVHERIRDFCDCKRHTYASRLAATTDLVDEFVSQWSEESLQLCVSKESASVFQATGNKQAPSSGPRGNGASQPGDVARVHKQFTMPLFGYFVLEDLPPLATDSSTIRQWWYRFLCSTRAMLSHPPNRLPIGLVSNEARSLLRSLHDHQPKPKLNLRQVPVRRKITASFDVSPHFVGRCAPPSVFCRHACLPAGPRPRVASLLNRDRSCRTRHKTGARRTVCQ